jgi:hypothetical protein
MAKSGQGDCVANCFRHDRESKPIRRESMPKWRRLRWLQRGFLRSSSAWGRTWKEEPPACSYSLRTKISKRHLECSSIHDAIA